VIVLEILGILLIVQGVGGFINNWAGGAPSWFLVNHLPALDGWELPASVVIALVGAALTARGEQARKVRRARD
jgi:hypothetical protein